MGKEIHVEKLRSYYDVSKFLDATKQSFLKDMLGITEEDEKRLPGMKNETEFLLIIYLLGQVKSITSIDESANPLTNSQSTDFLVETISGQNLAIEVKSSREREIIFSKNLVLRKKEFAEKYHCTPYFAIKLMGHWALFSTQYILEHGRKISIEKDFLNSELEEIFGERIFLFPKGLKVTSTYSKSLEGIKIMHPDYGNAVRIRAIAHGVELFCVQPGKREENLILSIVLENIHDVMSNQDQEIIQLDADRTLVIEKLTENTFFKLSCFLMAPIRHIVDEKMGECYTFERFKEVLKEDKSLIIDRKMVLAVLSFLDKKGYPIIMFLDGKGERLCELQV